MIDEKTTRQLEDMTSEQRMALNTELQALRFDLDRDLRAIKKVLERIRAIEQNNPEHGHIFYRRIKDLT